MSQIQKCGSSRKLVISICRPSVAVVVVLELGALFLLCVAFFSERFSSKIVSCDGRSRIFLRRWCITKEWRY